MLRYIVYCDESSSNGDLYTDFFGGCIIEASKIRYIEERLNERKRALNLKSEIKWTHVSEQYLDKYIQMIHTFFEYVRAGIIKVRIMFRKKRSDYSADEKYAIRYLILVSLPEAEDMIILIGKVHMSTGFLNQKDMKKVPSTLPEYSTYKRRPSS